ncbi:hypothetical protein [Phenylobacterium montanum]|uniref:Uncharacterized protein n=1 Tax=Phenylobacterium montanum TaxID=2823693 RepID=A0A975IUU1_9CAUL|nr:hypothetical protein [Caulobacter sp. S6]QUD87869.1 hypothetical protein KCG34_22965 [Caulobacter sp. S6]
MEKPHRDLAKLERSGSSARLLSLFGVHKRYGGDPLYRAEPFFRDPVLNRAIILKHRLRRDEMDLFPDGRLTTTKIILPIDGRDLRLGGRSVLVGQAGYDGIMESVFGARWAADDGDRHLLELIDSTLSVDPFLLREHLRRNGRYPARFYFDLSLGDHLRMQRFVERDIREVAQGRARRLAAGGHQGDDPAAEARLVKRLLSGEGDSAGEPLRRTLKLDEMDFAEAIFAWKGFLYYKWTLLDALPRARGVAKAIAGIRPLSADAELVRHVEPMRRAVARTILVTCEGAKRALNAYDEAFASLVNGQPEPFRDFLRGAHERFTDLGQDLGAVGHIVSFWSYRFPTGAAAVEAEELYDILLDFEEALNPSAPLRLSA